MQAVGEVAPNAVPELRRLLDHYRERVELYYWGQGASPSVTATFRFGGWRVQPWSIYTGDYLGVAVNFDWMKALGDERRSELLRKLLSIPGTEPKLAGVAEAGFAKRPTLSLAGVLDSLRAWTGSSTPLTRRSPEPCRGGTGGVVQCLPAPGGGMTDGERAA